MTGKTPNDKAAEQALIAIALLDSGQIPAIIGLIDPGEFYNIKYREMWEGILSLATENKEVTVASLYKRMGERATASEISAMMDGVPKSADAKYYAGIVREKARLRSIIESAQRLGSAASRGDTDEIAGLIDTLGASKVTGKRSRALSEEINKWVETTAAPFSLNDCFNSLHGVTLRDRPNVRTVLHRLKERGVIESTGKREGIYRRIQNTCPEMDWRAAPDNEIAFKLPLGLNELVCLYGKSLIVIAGESNYGKSAIILNMIKDNMNEFPIHYFTSEFGPSKMKKRFSLFEDVPLDAWKLKVYARAHDFHDAIRPDEINIIDWLWSGTAFYEAGGDLEKIFAKLHDGIAIVALQKDPGKEYGRGGAITKDLASLYLSVFPGEVKIVKAKDWKTEDNPNGKVLKLKIVHGSKLLPDGAGWQYPESLEAANRAFGGRGFKLKS